MSDSPAQAKRRAIIQGAAISIIHDREAHSLVARAGFFPPNPAHQGILTFVAVWHEAMLVASFLCSDPYPVPSDMSSIMCHIRQMSDQDAK